MKKLKISLSIIAFILLIFAINYSKNLRLDASSDTLVLQNDETFKYFESYNKIFPSKNFLVLAIKSKKKINQKYINNINQIKKKLLNIEDVESVFSIVDAPILLLNNKTFQDLGEKEIENINNSNYDLNKVLDEFKDSPIFKEQIINDKKNISSIIIYLKENIEFNKTKEKKKVITKNKIENNLIIDKYKKLKQLNNIRKEKIILDIREILKDSSIEYEYFLGGIDMISIDSINYIKNDIKIFSIAVFFLIIVILFFIYKEIKWVFIPLLTTLYSVILMTGIIGFLNWEITAISSNFISLMLILSISMNIHIINNYKINYHKVNIKNKLKKTLNIMFWPCIYTSLTTIVAFGSLLFSNIKPLIDFGGIMIIALNVIFITSFTILPLLIYISPSIENKKKITFQLTEKFYNLSVNYTKNILIINFSIFLISAFGIYKLNVENSFINYFKSNTQIYKGMKIIDTELGGTTPIDIIVKFKNENNTHIIEENNNQNKDDLFEDDLFEDDLFEDDLFENFSKNENWFTVEKLETIKKIHNFLESRKEIGKVQSIYSLVDVANLINKKEMNIFELSILYNEIPELYKQRLINPYLSIKENTVKISARVRDSENINRNLLIKEINFYLGNNFKQLESFKVNGLLVLYNNMLQSLFQSQINSFGIILISIFLMFLILFRSIKISIIAIIPNIIASTFILGIIGILNIPLDIMTITIAAITIGIAVDNTIHYIYRIMQNKKKYHENLDRIKYTHEDVGVAVITTSATIALGFSVLCISNFIPTVLFGIFTSLAMIVAMLGVLVTLPSLIIRLNYD